MNIQNILRDNTWSIVLLAIVVSFLIPKFGVGISPFVGYLLMILMYLSCLDISGKKIIEQFINWKKILALLLVVHLLSPFLIFLLKPFLSTEIFVGLILVATMPAGMSAVFLSQMYCQSKTRTNKIVNFFYSIFNRLFPISSGPASKALVVITISHILSPIIVPLVMLLFTSTLLHIDVWLISLTIIKFVLIPIAFATLFTSKKKKKQFKKYSSSISLFLLFFILLGVISPLREIILSNLRLSLFVSLLVFVLLSINFLVGYLIGADYDEKITYGISAYYKNFVLASVVALSLFSPLYALPAIIYAVMSNFFLIPLQLIILRKK